MTFKEVEEGKYIVNAMTPGEAFINVEADGKAAGQVKFRVKRLPDPVAMIKNSTGGKVKAEYIKDSEGIKAMLTNFDFDARCKITGFNMVRVAQREDPVEAINYGGNYGGNYGESAQKLVDQAKDGDIYYFEKVKCRCPGDPGERPLNSIVFKITGGAE